MKPDYYGVILIHVKVQTKIKVVFSSPKQNKNTKLKQCNLNSLTDLKEIFHKSG